MKNISKSVFAGYTVVSIVVLATGLLGMAPAQAATQFACTPSSQVVQINQEASFSVVGGSGDKNKIGE